MTDNLDRRLRSTLHGAPLPPAPDALYARLADLAVSRPQPRHLPWLRLAWSIVAVAALLVVLLAALVLGTGAPPSSPAPSQPSATPLQSAEATMPTLPAASPWLLLVPLGMDDGGATAAFAADHLSLPYSAVAAGTATFAHPAGNHPGVIVVRITVWSWSL